MENNVNHGDMTGHCIFFRNKDAVSQMAVCPGNTAEPLSSTSENLQNKEVCSMCLLLWEDLIDIPPINSSNNYRTLTGCQR